MSGEFRGIQMMRETTVSMASTPAFFPASTGILQRKCACGQHTGGEGACPDCSKKKQDAAQSGGGTFQRHTAGIETPTRFENTAPPIVHDVLRSAGQPLDTAMRSFFEPRFGHDFSRVRVHTDARAAESARAVDAFAYTVGQHVVFAEGQYAPAAAAGRSLLAHELTHTVQQSGGGPMQSGPLQLAGITAPNDPYEREANFIAGELANRRHVDVRLKSHSSTIRRQAIPTGIRLKEIKPFGRSDLANESDKKKYLTYMGATTLMQLIPTGDYTPGQKKGDCIKEHLTPLSSTCPPYEFCSDHPGQDEKKPHEKCLEVGRFGTRGGVTDGPDTFIDRHASIFPTSFLGEHDKKACSAVCHQRYAYRTASDHKEQDLGSFYIVRNFRREKYTPSDSKTAMNVTTGEVKKVPVDLAAPSKEKFAKDIAPGLVKSGSLQDAPPVPKGKTP
jgi:hypothetical protein